MRSEIRFNGKLYNMIEDGAYKDDNGYYIVHAYDPMEQPDAYGWMNSYYVRCTANAAEKMRLRGFVF